MGGGLGVAYVEGEQAPTMTEWALAIREAAEAEGVTARVSAEPGRSIVARAAVTAYTVGTIKEIPGTRTYVSVDGGMSDNPRPVLYGSGYEAFIVSDVRGNTRPCRDDCWEALRERRFHRSRCSSPISDSHRRRGLHSGDGRLRPFDVVQLQQGAAASGHIRSREQGADSRRTRVLR